MDGISVIEARDRLDALLDEVERGNEVVIVRDGRSVARLVPAAAAQGAQAAVRSLRTLRGDLAAGGLRVTAADLKELRDAGRR